jgi:ribosomal-protein-alanine N-acetyltransferase
MTEKKITRVGSEAVACLLEIEKQRFNNPWNIKHFNSAVNSPKMDISAYFLDNEIVGYIVLYRIRKVLVIANLAVAPGNRRKGIGEALLEYGIESGQKHHCTYSFLDVRQSNQAALSLYGKQGFVIVGSNKGYYKNPCEDSFIMGRAI